MKRSYFLIYNLSLKSLSLLLNDILKINFNIKILMFTCNTCEVLWKGLIKSIWFIGLGHNA